MCLALRQYESISILEWVLEDHACLSLWYPACQFPILPLILRNVHIPFDNIVVYNALYPLVRTALTPHCTRGKVPHRGIFEEKQSSG
jgi:hypothetical protein